MLKSMIKRLVARNNPPALSWSNSNRLVQSGANCNLVNYTR